MSKKTKKNGSAILKWLGFITALLLIITALINFFNANNNSKDYYTITITGKIVNEKTKAPVQALRIELKEKETQTDSDGKFILEGINIKRKTKGITFRYKLDTNVWKSKVFTGFNEVDLQMGHINDVIIRVALEKTDKNKDKKTTQTTSAVKPEFTTPARSQNPSNLLSHLNCANKIEVQFRINHDTMRKYQISADDFLVDGQKFSMNIDEVEGDDDRIYASFCPGSYTLQVDRKRFRSKRIKVDMHQMPLFINLTPGN